jgi:hypothetical protein
MIPFLAVLCFSTLGQPMARQSLPSIFTKMFPAPTGRNGLEDYIKAGDLLITSTFWVYQAWKPPEKRPTQKQILADAATEEKLEDKPDPAVEALTSHLNTLSYLQVKTEEVEKFGTALDLIREGNQKPFVMVGGAAPFDFPPLSWTKAAGRLANDAAYVSFASGNSSRATQILDDELIMSHRFDGGPLISAMIAQAIRSTLFRLIFDQLGMLSLADLQRIDKTATEILADRGSINQMIQSERRQASEMGRLELSYFKLGDVHNAGQDLYAQYKKLSPDQRDAWIHNLELTVDNGFDAVYSLFQNSEDQWLAKAEPDEADKDDEDIVKSLADIKATVKLSSNLLRTRNMVVVLMTGRTQLRLLHLHAKVLEFRWKSGRLPASLAELILAKTETYDPLSRKPFIYTPKGDSYKLASAGVPETGEIELTKVKSR